MSESKKQELSKEEYEKFLKLQASEKKRREMYRRNSARRNARLMVFAQKAKAAGITVTDEEITEYLKNNNE